MIVISPPCGILIFQKLSYLYVLCVFMFVSMLLTSNSNKIDYKKERKKEKRKKKTSKYPCMDELFDSPIGEPAQKTRSLPML